MNYRSRLMVVNYLWKSSFLEHLYSNKNKEKKKEDRFAYSFVRTYQISNFISDEEETNQLVNVRTCYSAFSSPFAEIFFWSTVHPDEMSVRLLAIYFYNRVEVFSSVAFFMRSLIYPALKAVDVYLKIMKTHCHYFFDPAYVYCKFRKMLREI